MMVLSYITGQRNYKIDYEVKRILGYLFFAIALYFLSSFIINVMVYPGTFLKFVINSIILLAYLFALSKMGTTAGFVKSLKYLNRMKVKIINRSSHALPAYETVNSAGMDLRANLDSPVELLPLHRQLLPTGLFIELPEGYEAQIRPRSGLAFKHGITVLNTPGTIDADYRGEIKVLLVNLSDQPFLINNGERIAQMIVAQHSRVEWTEATDLSGTERGAGGFGHTGSK